MRGVAPLGNRIQTSPSYGDGGIVPRGAPGTTARLSRDAEKVLESAWHESFDGGDPKAIDTADLIIGLLDVPSTARTLHGLGITAERVRAAKRESRGYELSGRFSSLHFKRPTKSPQVGRVAQLVAATIEATGREIIQPEDILEIIATDGLGWGVGILEELGVTSHLLQERMREPLAGLLARPVADDGQAETTGSGSVSEERQRDASESRIHRLKTGASRTRQMLRPRQSQREHSRLSVLRERMSLLVAEVQQMERAAAGWAQSPNAREAQFNKSRSLRPALVSEELLEKRAELDELTARVSELDAERASRADVPATAASRSVAESPTQATTSEPLQEKTAASPATDDPPTAVQGSIAQERPTELPPDHAAPALDHWLLARVAPEHLAPVRQFVKELRFRPGEVVFREGEPSHGLYLVMSGSIQVAARDDDGRQTVGVAQRHAVIGEMGMLDGQPRTGTATAVDAASAYFVPATQLRGLMERSPLVRLRLLAILTRKLRDGNQPRTVLAPASSESKAPRHARFMDVDPEALAETRRYLIAALPLVKSLDYEYRRWMDHVSEDGQTLSHDRDPDGRLSGVYLWRAAQHTRLFTVMRPSDAAERYHRAVVLCVAAREDAARGFSDAAASSPIKDARPAIKAANRRLLEAERLWSRAQAARRVLEADPSLAALWRQATPMTSPPEKAVVVAPVIRGALPRAGEQADVLRALGHFLDEQKARGGIQIKGHDGFLSVFWLSDGPGGLQRAYQEHALDTLRARARGLRRGSASGTPDGAITELLRTIGQQLDDQGIEVTGISQEPLGVRVSGLRDGVYHTRLWVTSEIDERSAAGREARRKQPA